MIRPYTIHSKVALAFDKLPVRVLRQTQEYPPKRGIASGAVYFLYKGANLRFDYSYDILGGRKDIPRVGDIRAAVWEDIESTAARARSVSSAIV